MQNSLYICIQIDMSKLNSLGIIHQCWLFIRPNAYLRIRTPISTTFGFLMIFDDFWWFLMFRPLRLYNPHFTKMPLMWFDSLSLIISTSPRCPCPNANNISFSSPSRSPATGLPHATHLARTQNKYTWVKYRCNERRILWRGLTHLVR